MDVWEDLNEFQDTLYHSLVSLSYLQSSNSNVIHPVSLQCICVRILLQQCNLLPKKLENLLDIYRMHTFLHSLALSDIDLERSGLTNSVNENRKGIRERFPALLEKIGPEDLQECLSEDFYQDLLKMYEHTIYVKNRMASYRSGIILEPEKIDITQIQQSQDGFYPLAALLQGVEWPSNVDPSKREEYLSLEEFRQVFGMTKEAFQTLPKFTRVRLKKEKRLF